MKGRSSVIKQEEIIGGPIAKQEEDIRRIHRTKQVRRRLHTSRPYQERLLNMAEARREIVTALKYHRATMRTKQPPPHSEDDQKSMTSSCPSPNASLSYLNTLLPLPSQPLGLNLNFNHIMHHLTAATPTPTPSPSPPNFTTSPGMHAALEMAEIKSVAEQHQLEYWSDSMSLDCFNFDHLPSQSSLFPRMDISGDIEPMDDVDDWLA